MIPVFKANSTHSQPLTLAGLIQEPAQQRQILLECAERVLRLAWVLPMLARPLERLAGLLKPTRPIRQGSENRVKLNG